MSYRSDELAVLNNGRAAHECVNIGPTSFLGKFCGNFCKNTPKQAIFDLLRRTFISYTYNIHIIKCIIGQRKTDECVIIGPTLVC